MAGAYYISIRLHIYLPFRGRDRAEKKSFIVHRHRCMPRERSNFTVHCLSLAPLYSVQYPASGGQISAVPVGGTRDNCTDYRVESYIQLVSYSLQDCIQLQESP